MRNMVKFISLESFDSNQPSIEAFIENGPCEGRKTQRIFAASFQQKAAGNGAWPGKNDMARKKTSLFLFKRIQRIITETLKGLKITSLHESLGAKVP